MERRQSVSLEDRWRTYSNIPEIDAERKFVFVKKIQSTDMKYPRKAGTVTKKPLA